MVPENVILRYISVRNLARQGAPGERDNAGRILEQMRAKYPTIEAEVRAYERKGSPAEPSPAESPPPGWTGSSGPNQADARANTWENVFRYGQAFVNGVSGFAQNFGNVVIGRRLASYVQASVKVSRANNILLTMKMPPEVYHTALTDLNPLQLQAFREELHAQFDELLDQLLTEPSESESGSEGWEEGEEG